MIQTSEITSQSIASDNVVHNRLLYGYFAAKDYINGNLLDIGCGEGRGVEHLSQYASSYTGIDKNLHAINKLKEQYPKHHFFNGNVPPLDLFEDNSFDTVVTLHVLEHIQDDVLYIDEIYRVLKPGGQLIVSTPNIKMSLARNPWHVREYTKEQLETLLKSNFSSINKLGLFGNKKVMEYHEKNRRSVNKIMKFDIFNLQYKLPASWLQKPYEYLNRRNRNKLYDSNDSLVNEVGLNDFYLDNVNDQCFELYYIAKK